MLSSPHQKPGRPSRRHPLPKPSYAGVTATIALFLALAGGGAYAAGALPARSVGTTQLRSAAVTGAKVKDGSLTGADIAVGTLGTVPAAAAATRADSAAHADSATRADTAAHADSASAAAVAGEAQTLGGKTAAELTADSKLRCPSGMRVAVGVCIEEAVRTGNELPEALAVCGKLGLRMPTEGELLAYERRYEPTSPVAEWVEPEYVVNGSFFGMAVSQSQDGGGSILGLPYSAKYPYRCAIPASN